MTLNIYTTCTAHSFWDMFLANLHVMDPLKSKAYADTN